MDALRDFSKSRTSDWVNFARPWDEPSKTKYPYYRLTSLVEPPAPQQPRLTPGVDSLANIIKESEQVACDPGLDASFILVCAPRHYVNTVGFTQEHFEKLAEAFDIDPWITNAFCLGEFGLHWIQSPDGQRLSYCLILYHYTIVWSYDFKTSQTRAIVALPMVTTCLPLAGEIFPGKAHPFMRLLERAAPTNFQSPVLLAWVALVCLIDSHIEDVRRDGVELRGAEALTKHGPFLEPGIAAYFRPTGSPSIKHLTESSERTGAIIGNQAKLTWEISIGFEVAQHIKKPDYPTPTAHGKMDSLVDTIPHLERVLGAANGALKRFQKRADVQLSIIAALMAHEDTRVSNELAAASTKIAEESKKDASSMKTIAIMTMAFLPATYLAALWAIPSLDPSSLAATDDSGMGGGVFITHNFGIYWAVTLPVTALVFFIWFWLNATREKRDKHGNWSVLFQPVLNWKLSRRRRYNGSLGYDSHSTSTESDFSSRTGTESHDRRLMQSQYELDDDGSPPSALRWVREKRHRPGSIYAQSESGDGGSAVERTTPSIQEGPENGNGAPARYSSQSVVERPPAATTTTRGRSRSPPSMKRNTVGLQPLGKVTLPSSRNKQARRYENRGDVRDLFLRSGINTYK